jgi:hypothetical protein
MEWDICLAIETHQKSAQFLDAPTGSESFIILYITIVVTEGNTDVSAVFIPRHHILDKIFEDGSYYDH